ncbi:Uncharacterized [Moorella glycerini]|uniref:Uncharacterized protein n=1 Tax=Neomoorella stamsii TaxID=1266720 RepID=A0A9X7J0B9_9FIRM|nr:MULTISPECIES: hypothetical protein [Moorella]PRR69569.1 hypothetical protein MOST_29910 [Moorella stamsii]CEP67907.1 Uncharacterized [Moorella glycerini]CEP68777.1 Uncharacterized [Moorella glycerini]
MLTIQNVALLNDIIQLPKDNLQEICTNLDLSRDGSSTDLAEKIWLAICDNREKQNRILEPYKNRILCGKTSITWFKLSPGGSLKGAKEKIIKNCGFNPFETINIPPPEELSGTPVLISGAIGANENEYYLRFIYKSGVSRLFYGAKLDLRPKSAVKTIYINEEKGCIEVRADGKAAGKFASSFARLINQEISLEPTNILAPFGGNIEEIADAIGGELIDAVGKPELLLQDFTTDQANAVVDILTALDNYFEDEDIDKLQESLEASKALLGDEFPAIPFTALILNGLEKVGLGVSDRDLRGLPLYDYLKPHLQHQGGFIRFSFPENGLMQSFTIRVGFHTNSIYFITPATENAIEHVRERIIIEA